MNVRPIEIISLWLTVLSILIAVYLSIAAGQQELFSDIDDLLNLPKERLNEEKNDILNKEIKLDDIFLSMQGGNGKSKPTIHIFVLDVSGSTPTIELPPWYNKSVESMIDKTILDKATPLKKTDKKGTPVHSFEASKVGLAMLLIDLLGNKSLFSIWKVGNKGEPIYPLRHTIEDGSMIYKEISGRTVKEGIDKIIGEEKQKQSNTEDDDTNFNSLLAAILKEYIEEPSAENPTPSLIITIFSDFYHDAKDSITEAHEIKKSLKGNIKKLSNQSVTLNMVKLQKDGSISLSQHGFPIIREVKKNFKWYYMASTKIGDDRGEQKSMLYPIILVGEKLVFYYEDDDPITTINHIMLTEKMKGGHKKGKFVIDIPHIDGEEQEKTELEWVLGDERFGRLTSKGQIFEEVLSNNYKLRLEHNGIASGGTIKLRFVHPIYKRTYIFNVSFVKKLPIFVAKTLTNIKSAIYAISAISIFLLIVIWIKMWTKRRAGEKNDAALSGSVSEIDPRLLGKWFSFSPIKISWEFYDKRLKIASNNNGELALSYHINHQQDLFVVIHGAKEDFYGFLKMVGFPVQTDIVKDILFSIDFVDSGLNLELIVNGDTLNHFSLTRSDSTPQISYVGK